MAEGPLLGKIQDLSDLELAVLLCLTAQEHCIINTEPGFLEDLVHELRLVDQHLVEVLIVLYSNAFRLLQMSSALRTP
jgi:hypothetical protein